MIFSINIENRKDRVKMNELYEVLQDLVPTQVQLEWGVIVSFLGSVFSFIFGYNIVVEALLVAMCLDYVSGIIAAYVNPEMTLNSQKGFKGICKKITILILVSLAHFIDLATSQNFIHIVVTWFFLGNEGLSIVENAAKIGVPIPAKLKKSLEQLSNEKYKRGNRK